MKSARPSLTALRTLWLMKSELTRMCPSISGATYSAGPMVSTWTISTSSSCGARRTSAPSSSFGTEQLPVMKTRSCDWIASTATSAEQSLL